MQSSIPTLPPLACALCCQAQRMYVPEYVRRGVGQGLTDAVRPETVMCDVYSILDMSVPYGACS